MFYFTMTNKDGIYISYSILFEFYKPIYETLLLEFVSVPNNFLTFYLIFTKLSYFYFVNYSFYTYNVNFLKEHFKK